VKGKLRLVFVTTMTIAISTGVVRGTEEQDESFGQKLKDFSFDRRQRGHFSRRDIGF